MIIKVFEKAEYADRSAADCFIAQLNQKPDSVLALPTGGTPINTYRALVEAYGEGRISFRRAKTFNIDEYAGLSAGHPVSFRHFMNENLFDHIDIDKNNTFFPAEGCEIDDTGVACYDARIIVAGGIDLELLGIGSNGHLALNEPGTAFDSLTHLQKVEGQTREALARFCGGDAGKVPEYAATLGLKGIMNARKILLLAYGSNKAQAVYDTVRGPVTQDVPASVLQLHPDCTLLLDTEAASLL